MTAILGSGTAALAVNATFPTVESTPPVLETPAAAVQGTSDPSVVPLDLPAPNAAPAAPASTPTAPATVTEFQIPGAGVVAVLSDGVTLSVSSVAPMGGYTYTVSEPTPGVFEVRFESATDVVRFDVRLVDGRLTTAATQEAKAPPPAPATAAASPAPVGPAPASPPPAAPVGDHDDDDDDHDEYEFEYEDDDEFEFEFEDHDDD